MQKQVFFRNRWLGVALVVPQILLIFTFFYWPAGQALFWAFTLQRPWGGGNEWVGFQNFRDMLSDPIYWNSVARSLVFAFISTGLAMAAAFVLAVLTDRELRGHKIYRSALVWPYAIAAPALALAFRFILAPEAGFLAFLNKLSPGLWNPTLDGLDAMIAIIIAFAWKSVGYNFIFFLLVIGLTDSFTDSFGIVDIMTSGGPDRATEMMVYKIYFDGFKGLDYSGAAAQSIILMLLVILLTVVQFRFVERRIHYR